MLILTCKKNETITVTLPTGEIISITVTKANNNQTRLGFKAPESIKIFRNKLN